MKNLAIALDATRRLLEDPSHESTINPPGSEKPNGALGFVLDVLKANFPPEQRADVIKDTARKVFMHQQNIERLFKRVWRLYVVAQQHIGRPSYVDNAGNTQDIRQALDSIFHAFHVHPFTVSSEGGSGVNLSPIAILNRNHETTTRHEQVARRIGKAWVDDRVCGYNPQFQDLGALQISLFELLWSGTVEQLKRQSVYLGEYPERPEFEGRVEELERALRAAIVRSKKERFTIAFFGMVNSGKSLFLNALIGRAILPSDGGTMVLVLLHSILNIAIELPSTAWPCRLRHVEGQTIPELHFQAEPFLAALEKLQTHQYGRKIQTYQPPSEDMFEALRSNAPSKPPAEEFLLRKMHSQWIDLHPVTRDNLLKFENPKFRLPRMASGEQNVKDLVSFDRCHTAPFSTEPCF